MAKGFTGTLLRVDLTRNTIEKVQMPEEFYRTYMGGTAFGAYFLLKELSGAVDAFDEKNIITIATGAATGAAVSGASRCCITALSPETGGAGDTQLGGSIGPMIKRAGFDAVVITGKAEKPSYLMVNDDAVEIMDAGHIRGKTILEAHDVLTKEHGTKNISILQCGPAGEKRVRFSCLMGDLNDAAGRGGMGAVFGSKNLRALVVKSSNMVEFADTAGLKALARIGSQRLPGSGFPETLKKYGTPGVLAPQAEGGNLATHNFSRSWHKDYLNLHGATYEKELAAGSTTCFGCVVSCRKKVKAELPWKVTDRLGGPEFETLGLLGSNLDITDPAAVAKANELCNNYGLDTISTGGAAAFLFECLEKGILSKDDCNGKELGFNDPEGLFWLIEQIVNRQGIGDTLADGLVTAVKKLGKKTAPFAIHVKNKVPAVHMAQVKPSLALMYAVSPIGADHMSNEHDWLLSSQADISKGLGILGNGDASCADLNKVRMTAYSQYYYSLLDTLCLCMFCWGCGSLFTYRDLEDIVKSATGWDCTMFELMKVGERRVAMLRQINARQGFTAEDDTLPSRLFEKLPDGPAKGRCVDSKLWPEMKDQYYEILGWDRKTGNPKEGRLRELGLEWAL
ncbi:MAG: aldehyde:ferredoxin oxidoreductase [Deltaproteobacteria bacterium]|nr:MAG: aldehyde:ferredoxin oxidoreductase [Deltaproteobacteria bacterium]RLC21361.1 MAG: aldehyde:ferredoxin oxidoreductase [Deltaproteobacteria bacterium]